MPRFYVSPAAFIHSDFRPELPQKSCTEAKAYKLIDKKHRLAVHALRSSDYAHAVTVWELRNKTVNPVSGYTYHCVIIVEAPDQPRRYFYSDGYYRESAFIYAARTAGMQFYHSIYSRETGKSELVTCSGVSSASAQTLPPLFFALCGVQLDPDKSESRETMN